MMTDDKHPWLWYVSHNEETWDGPCGSRDEALKIAKSGGYGFICEAKNAAMDAWVEKHKIDIQAWMFGDTRNEEEVA
jgi:hypothetical protein